MCATRSSPWESRADSLRESEGPYADFAAWEEWMSASVDEVLFCGEWDSMTTTTRVGLYNLFRKVADAN